MLKYTPKSKNFWRYTSIICTKRRHIVSRDDYTFY